MISLTYILIPQLESQPKVRHLSCVKEGVWRSTLASFQYRLLNIYHEKWSHHNDGEIQVPHILILHYCANRCLSHDQGVKGCLCVDNSIDSNKQYRPTTDDNGAW